MKTYLSVLENSLLDLSKTSQLLAIKAEFEAEGTRIEELSVLSQLCCKYSIPLTLKVGGPSASRDIYEAFQLGASNILIPMVESPFAVEVCSETFSKLLPVFHVLKQKPKLFVNIETKLAVKNLDSILQTIDSYKLPISSIVLGRTDLSASLNISDVNSLEIFEIAKQIHTKASSRSIGFTVGGNLSTNSFEFIDRLSSFGLDSFESRKCTFRSSKNSSREYFVDIINKGLQFELAWLRYKRALYELRSAEENIRIDVIKARIE